MPIQTKQSARAIAGDLLRLPGELPEIPEEILQRFKSAKGWMQQQEAWWSKAQNSLNEFASTVQDGLSMGNVLNVDGQAGSIYIRNQRGPGKWDDPDTPFYVNRASYFSLGSSLTWNPVAKELIIDGTIFAVAGEIGGFEIGADYIRDQADSMGLASTVTGGDDVRFWAGDTFANRATAPFRVTEAGVLTATNAVISGSITATSGSIGNWAIGATTISANNAVLDSAGQLLLGTGNDIVILSATDATYRLWVGNATAGTAAFSVTKAGVMTASNGVFSGTITSTSGTIAGFSITSGGLSAGTGATTVLLNNDLATGLVFGDPSSLHLRLRSLGTSVAGLECYNTSNIAVANLLSTTSGTLTLLSAAGVTNVSLSGATGAATFGGTVTGNLFSGSGASITSLSASNVSSGTLDNARLPSAISVTSLAGSGSGITALNASNLSTGTVPDARFPSTLPAVSGVNLTSLNASNIASGTINNSRLPSAISVASLVLSSTLGVAGHITITGSGSNLVLTDGVVTKSSPGGWGPYLYDGTNLIELRYNSPNVEARINNSTVIVLG